jgi:hypothetical protein
MATLLRLLRLTSPHPPDPGFKPYYERFLGGDLRAIENYCNENSHPGASFYELIGRLFLLRHHSAAAGQILARIEHSAKVSKRPIYAFWYTLLHPLCQRARQFINRARASRPDANRSELWRDYLSQSALAPSDDELQTAISAVMPDNWQVNQRDEKSSRVIIQELLAWSEKYTEASVRSDLISRGYRGKKLQSMTRSEFHFENVDRFSRWSLVSREIFRDLAQTSPALLTPAAVARRYSCWIAGVSESWASRKTMRK